MSSERGLRRKIDRRAAAMFVEKIATDRVTLNEQRFKLWGVVLSKLLESIQAGTEFPQFAELPWEPFWTPSESWMSLAEFALFAEFPNTAGLTSNTPREIREKKCFKVDARVYKES